MTTTPPTSFSERRGFTLVGGSPTTVGPVVTRLDGSRGSFTALKTAVGHAMMRTCGMVVLDETDSSIFPFPPGVISERERSVVVGIFGNDHVSRLPVETTGLAETIERAVDLEASLLVLNADDLTLVRSTPALLGALLDSPFDVLMLAPHQEIDLRD